MTETEILSRFHWSVSLERLLSGEGGLTNKVPRGIYQDPDLFKLEMKKLFTGPTWNLVAHEAEIPNPGDYKTTRIADVPIVVCRTDNGGVKVLLNTCPHRGAKVVNEACGNASGRGFRCIYHQWSYDMDGRCIGVTLPDDFPEDFVREDYGMTALRTETLSGAIFATFHEGTPPLEPYLGRSDFTRQIRDSLHDGKLKLLGQQKIIFDCNWKLYMENMYDGYHALVLHKGVKMLGGRRPRKAPGETLSPNYDTYGHGWQHYLNDGSKEQVLNDMSIVAIQSKPKNEEGLCENNILFTFPANIVSDQADTLTIRYVLPKAVDRTEVHFTIFAPLDENDRLLDHRIRQGSNLFGPSGVITLEDGFALKRIQASAASEGDNALLKGTPKKFPPYRINDEAAIAHFYTGYRRMMGF